MQQFSRERKQRQEGRGKIKGNKGRKKRRKKGGKKGEGKEAEGRRKRGEGRTLEKLANIDDCFGLTASEMTGAGTCMLVSVYWTCPSVKESIDEQSTPNMAQTSPALMLSISSS